MGSIAPPPELLEFVLRLSPGNFIIGEKMIEEINSYPILSRMFDVGKVHKSIVRNLTPYSTKKEIKVENWVKDPNYIVPMPDKVTWPEDDASYFQSNGEEYKQK